MILALFPTFVEIISSISVSLFHILEKAYGKHLESGGPKNVEGDRANPVSLTFKPYRSDSNSGFLSRGDTWCSSLPHFEPWCATLFNYLTFPKPVSKAKKNQTQLTKQTKHTVSSKKRLQCCSFSLNGKNAIRFCNIPISFLYFFFLFSFCGISKCPFFDGWKCIQHHGVPVQMWCLCDSWTVGHFSEAIIMWPLKQDFLHVSAARKRIFQEQRGPHRWQQHPNARPFFYKHWSSWCSYSLYNSSWWFAR